MTLQLTDGQTESVPKIFVRGQTLEFLMELPPRIPKYFFDNRERRAVTVMNFRLLTSFDESLLPNAGVYVQVGWPGASPLVVGAKWDTDLETTVALAAAALNNHFSDPTLRLPLEAEANGAMLYVRAKQPGTPFHNYEIFPQVGLEDSGVVFGVSHLTGGSAYTRASGSFLVQDMSALGTYTIELLGVTLEVASQPGDSVFDAAQRIADEVTTHPYLSKMVEGSAREVDTSFAPNSPFPVGSNDIWDAARVVLTAKERGFAGNDISYKVSSDTGASDTPGTLWGGTDLGATNLLPVETQLKAELRLCGQAGPAGFIADLNPQWEPGSGSTRIRFLVENTDEFPVGLAEFDVVFIRTVTQPDGTTSSKTYRSRPVRISIEDGVTQ